MESSMLEYDLFGSGLTFGNLCDSLGDTVACAPGNSYVILCLALVISILLMILNVLCAVYYKLHEKYGNSGDKKLNNVESSGAE
eukprot:Pgem_evm1s3948